MTLAFLLLLGLGFALACVNGANDVSKGIATLVGSGVTNYRRAILWGAGWTAMGSLLGGMCAPAMQATLAKGLLSSSAVPTLNAAMATLLGATFWLFTATRKGLPVSTTHAVVGSIIGVALAANGSSGVRWGTVGAKIFLPLVLSPLVSLAVVAVVSHLTRPRVGLARRDCQCAEIAPAVFVQGADPLGQALLSVIPNSIRLATDSSEACAKERPAALRLTLDHIHWLSSGAIHLARAMQDSAKIVALLPVFAMLKDANYMASPMLYAVVTCGVVTCGMVAGSVVAGRKVTHVLAEKITPMDHREGFVANFVTAGLVFLGATFGLPMSTTHVAAGGIFGLAMQRSLLNAPTVRDILFAWIVTLPSAACFGSVAYGIGQLLLPWGAL